MITKTYEVFDEYFNTLRKLGYMRWSAVSRILVLSTLQELIDSDAMDDFNDNEKKIIMAALSCLSQSECMMPIFDMEDFKPEKDLKYYGFIIRNIDSL